MQNQFITYMDVDIAKSIAFSRLWNIFEIMPHNASKDQRWLRLTSAFEAVQNKSIVLKNNSQSHIQVSSHVIIIRRQKIAWDSVVGRLLNDLIEIMERTELPCDC